MFKRKTTKEIKKKTCHIQLIGKQDQIIYEGEVFKLSITDECILKQCIYYYNDYNPCHIHKTAVSNRLKYEVEDYFINNPDEGIYQWEALPERIQHILKQEEKIMEVRILT